MAELKIRKQELAVLKRGSLTAAKRTLCDILERWSKGKMESTDSMVELTIDEVLQELIYIKRNEQICTKRKG